MTTKYKKDKVSIKQDECIEHRTERYVYWLERLINGTARPGDVTLRWNKLQEAHGKNKNKRHRQH